MKPIAIILFLLVTLVETSFAQYFASSYKPKNNTEKLIISKIQTLQEVKEWFKTTKKSEPDIIINLPDSTSKYYHFQVGLSNLNMFRTSFHLFVSPKTYDIFYLDFFDESGSKPITLQQWRQWRSKPGFFKMHRWKAGKLVVLKDDQKKSSHNHR